MLDVLWSKAVRGPDIFVQGKSGRALPGDAEVLGAGVSDKPLKVDAGLGNLLDHFDRRTIKIDPVVEGCVTGRASAGHDVLREVLRVYE